MRLAAYQQAGCIEDAKAALQEGLALGPGVHALGSVRGYTADLELHRSGRMSASSGVWPETGPSGHSAAEVAAAGSITTSWLM